MPVSASSFAGEFFFFGGQNGGSGLGKMGGRVERGGGSFAGLRWGGFFGTGVGFRFDCSLPSIPFVHQSNTPQSLFFPFLTSFCFPAAF